MTFTILLALAGLTLSGVAIYYSVIGLTAIFSAAFWPIVVMGTSLEVSKLVAASWLKANWTKIPKLMKWYMSIAVIVLMIITSMGIFGFLSKAHSDQNLVSGDVQSKIAVYDEKIKTAKENIDANRKALKQMDEAVDQVMGRSQDEKGADKAVALRRSQAKERTRLLSEITAEQKVIAQLSEERAPIAAEIRKVEAEVGPIKYIAAFIYGDDPDTNVLEKAVTWVIITIIVVFDPLAVLMLLASQMTWQWRKEELAEGDSPVRPESVINDTATTVTESSNDPAYEQDDGPLTEDQISQIKTLAASEVTWPFVSAHQSNTDNPIDFPKEESPSDIDAWNKMIEAAEAEVAKEKVVANIQWNDNLQAWLKNNPDADIYEFQRMFDAGKIDQLPWEVVESLEAHLDERPGDYVTQDEEAKKKTYMIKDQDGNKQILTKPDTSKTPNNPN